MKMQKKVIVTFSEIPEGIVNPMFTREIKRYANEIVSQEKSDGAVDVTPDRLTRTRYFINDEVAQDWINFIKSQQKKYFESSSDITINFDIADVDD
jgi:hypothetical protein